MTGEFIGVLRFFCVKNSYLPAHIHAIYNEYVGIFDICSFEMVDGDLPHKAQELVKEWLKDNYKSLIQMWNTQVINKLNPLE